MTKGWSRRCKTPEPAQGLPDVCATCGSALADSRYSFALSVNCMVLHPGAEDAEPDHELKLLKWPVAHFCSHGCCKTTLPALLPAYGFPEAVKDQRIGQGVIEPCGACGKPVNLTQPHKACQKNRCLWMDPQGDPDVAWMDIMAVPCANCDAFTQLRRELEEELARDPP